MRGVHKQIEITHGVSVDRGIAALVSALNGFDRVRTLDSCEGSDESPGYVYFTIDTDAAALLRFVHDLSVKLGACLSSCCEYKLRVEWLAGSDKPVAELIARHDCIPVLVEALSSFMAVCHTNQSADGR